MRNNSPIYYFNPAGWPIIAAAAAATFFLSFISWGLFFVGLAVTVFCFYFFRDPDRVTPIRPGLVVSPADGKIIAIEEVRPDADLGLGDAPRTRISIFLNVFNVHVNRIPAEGRIVLRRYRAGKFLNASFDKASDENERMALAIKLEGEHPHAGEELGVVQIAGLIARRIVCQAQQEQQVKAGDRYGIIRFGSRTDVYLPVGVKPLVCVGQTAIGAETVFADLLSTESARQGEVRQ